MIRIGYNIDSKIRKLSEKAEKFVFPSAKAYY